MKGLTELTDSSGLSAIIRRLFCLAAALVLAIACLCARACRRRRCHQGQPRYGRDRHDEGRAIFPFAGRRYHPDLDGTGRRRHRAPHRRQGAHRRLAARLDRLRAQQRFRPADRPLAGGAAFATHGLASHLARSRLDAHHRRDGERRLLARAPAGLGCRHLPDHARSGRHRHLCGRARDAGSAAALSVGFGRLQGEGERADALSRHRHRHRRPSGAVPHDHRRGQGRRDVPRRRGARLVGLRLHRHRFRLRAEAHGAADRRLERLPGGGRSDARGNDARLPLRLSQPQPLARALQPHHGAVAPVPPRPHRPCGRERAGGGGRGAHLARRGLLDRLPAHRLPRHPSAL